MRRPFLSITDAEWKTLCDANTTWQWIMENFDQPEWCNYPDALSGMMGCWSLVGRYVTGKKYCKNCECNKRVANMQQARAK
jgi:hypothetical protein